MKSNKNPLVSVIIPTYKRDVEILSRAINSILNQTYQNIEIVIVDDNAKESLEKFRDANKKYLFSLSKGHPNIKFTFNEKNLGGALSRNVGINMANGQYITFLDDDDLFLKDKVLHQINYMLANDLNCSFTDLSLFDENDKLIDKRVRNDITDFSKDYLLRYHLTKTISSTETFMIDRQILLDIGGFDDAVTGHEFYLMFKILNYSTLKIGYFESDDIKAYRTSQECISNGPNKIKGENAIYKFRKEHFDLLSHKERNYVKCRHRAVIANAYRRQHKYLKALFYLVCSFFTNPFLSFKEAFILRKNVKK